MERTALLGLLKPSIEIKPEKTIYHENSTYKDAIGYNPTATITKDAYKKGVPVELPGEKTK